MKRISSFLIVAGVVLCCSSEGYTQGADKQLDVRSSPPVRRQSPPFASIPSQSVQRAMPAVVPVPPATAPKAKQPRPSEVKAWQPTVVATGADNPSVLAQTLGPIMPMGTGEIRVEAKPRPAAPFQARLATSSAGAGHDSGQVPAAGAASGDAIGSDGQQYCSNIIDIAADQRFAWQKQVVADLGRDLEQRIKKLEEKTAEYKEWLAKRDEFISRATGNLVKIYARMKPDAAAAQLAQLDEETAAAVLSKLEPKATSTILNEMEPKRAALLTSIIAGAARLDQEGRKS